VEEPGVAGTYQRRTLAAEALIASEDVLSSYIKLKYEDWNAYSRHLTEWERQTTLDC
jgi:glutamine synthetase